MREAPFEYDAQAVLSGNIKQVISDLRIDTLPPTEVNRTSALGCKRYGLRISEDSIVLEKKGKRPEVTYHIAPGVHAPLVWCYFQLFKNAPLDRLQEMNVYGPTLCLYGRVFDAIFSGKDQLQEFQSPVLPISTMRVYLSHMRKWPMELRAQGFYDSWNSSVNLGLNLWKTNKIVTLRELIASTTQN